MRKVGWVVSMIWLQYAYVVTLDHCSSYIDLVLEPHPLPRAVSQCSLCAQFFKCRVRQYNEVLEVARW